jgi:hypothetical protein
LKEFRLRLNEKEIKLLLYALLKAFGSPEIQNPLL